MSEALRIMGMFPGLSPPAQFQITSTQTPKYNCIAWAAGEDKRWWWPSGDYFWPEGVSYGRTAEAFILAFATLGYERCESDDSENAFEKIALFTKPAGT